MDERELYFWDLAGHLIVRNVLTPDEIAMANEAIDYCQSKIPEREAGLGSKGSRALAGTGRLEVHELMELPRPYCEPFRRMLTHPAVVSRLNVMCGKGFRLDHGPLLIAGVKGTEGLTLHGSGEPHKPYVAYHHQNGVPYCGGVTVTWQLTDVNEGDGGFVCVPGSHKSSRPMPDGVRTCDEDMGVVAQPAMKAGDVLFFMDGAQTHGTHPWRSDRPRRSILFKYAARSCVRGVPSKDLFLPEVWWEEETVEGMTEEQRAVMFGPGIHHGGIVKALTLDERGTVQVDGLQAGFPRDAQEAGRGRRKRAGMDEREIYFWDLTGHLIVRNVLTPEDIAAANRAIDDYSGQIQVGEDNRGARGSSALRGTGRPTLHGLLELPRPYCEPFRRMLAHPAVVSRLNVMCGKGFRLDHGPLLIAGVKGTEGLTLHGSGEPHRSHVAYHHQNGVPYCGGVTVTWQLTDVNEGDGGFICVPGSHKSSRPMPDGVRTCDEDMGVVAQPAMKAGDVLFFMDGAQTHGTHPWRSERPRRSILFKYAARDSVRGGPAKDLAPPEVWWGDELVEGMDEAQRAVMFGPYSNHYGAVPSLSVDEDGTVRVEQ